MTSTLEAPSADPDTVAAGIDPRKLGLQTEAKLQDWNLPYRYEAEFPLDDLRSVEWTQVRSEASIADRETLAEFQTQMRFGAIYPPIVIMDPNQLVDGNHRVKAAQTLKRKTFPAFVVEFPTTDLAQAFNGSMNSLNGRRLAADEALKAALTMMARGMADEAIAREIGRSVERVRVMRREREFADRSAILPEIAEQAKQVSRPARSKLAQISHDPAFAEAVKLVAEVGAAPATVGRIVKAATSARTDTDAIAAVREIRADLAPAGPPPRRVTIPREIQQASMHLGGLLKLADNPLRLVDTRTETGPRAKVQWVRVRELADKVISLYPGE